jgi:hypothetical protein
VTSLNDVAYLIAEAHVNLREAVNEPLGEIAVEFREAALGFYAQANKLLQGEPLEGRHPVYGTGILVGVNQSGCALFHPDFSDRPLEVDVFELREVVR